MTLTSPKAGPSGLHVRYEKAGLILDQLPIPWNADAVIVEAHVRLPALAPREKQHFTLQLSSGAPALCAELLREAKQAGPRPARRGEAHVFFRIPVPAQTCAAEVFWREHSLGKVELPVIGAAEVLESLSLQMPTLQVGLGDATVASRTFVGAQCQSLCASALLSAAGPLAPVADLQLRIEVCSAQGERIAEVPVHFTSEQLRARQALVTVLLPKLRRTGEYSVAWMLGARRLHAHSVRTITKKKLLSSLRISATRFVVQRHDGEISMVRWLPQRDGELMLEGIARIGPCFFVCSGEAGLAGLATFTVEAAGDGAPVPMIAGHEMLVTDGPMPLLPGTIAAADARGVKQFALASSAGRLGSLSLLTAPTAQFTAEGGFTPLDDFLWSPAADEQFNDRLGKLLGS